jgi:hypothetical protein
MTAVYALYDDPAIVQRAVDGLRRAGIAEDDIVVMSSEPFEEYEFSHRDKADWLYKVAGAGGVAGFAFGAVLTTATQLAWPLKTSGMPIVAPWPNMIVVFELTMLGAVLATVVTLFISAKLPTRLSRFYDPAISDGYILVGVQEPGEKRPVIAEALQAAGPGQLKSIDQ